MNAAIRVSNTLLRSSQSLPRQASASKLPSLQSSKAWICDQCYKRAISSKKSSACASYPAIRSSRNDPRRDQIPSIGRPRSRTFSTRDDDGPASARKELPSHKESRQSPFYNRFSSMMDHAQSNIFIAGQRLNDLTGYSGIEALKKDIEEQELTLKSTRSALQAARSAYSNAISDRSSSQREVNTLLQRKHEWTPVDLERFTALYRSDHANEQNEASARDTLTRVEKESEEAAAKLSATILARYHEEQIWSDKIRRMSTWGTWGLMGVNVLLFVVFQIGVEPWRRKRLVKGFEEKVAQALERGGNPQSIGNSKAEENVAELAAADMVSAVEPAIDEAVAEAEQTLTDDGLSTSVDATILAERNEVPHTSTTVERDSTLNTVKNRFQDMFSERQIVLRRVDLTTAALEGAAAGVAFVGVLVLLLRPQ